MTTDKQGVFSFPGDADQDVPVSVCASEYTYGYTRNISIGSYSIPPGTEGDMVAVMPLRSGFEIVLTWAEFPADLDAQLATVRAEGAAGLARNIHYNKRRRLSQATHFFSLSTF